MWSKPSEITRGVYSGNGYEIGFGSPQSGLATPEAAIAGWLGSLLHSAVMLERGIWAGKDWQALGVAIHGRYAVAWFGEEHDAT